MPPIGGWKTGVYAIVNLSNNKRYVGSATRSLTLRWKEHQNALIGGRHFNKHLQSAWDKYGGAVFKFEILERCSPEKCLDWEQYYIDWYRSHDRRFGYNGRPTAENNRGMKFRPHTEEHKAKLRASSGNRRGFRHSVETRLRLSKIQRGSTKIVRKVAARGAHSAETRAKIGAANSIALRGRKLSEETKAKISAALTGVTEGKRLSEEHKAKLSLAKKGKPWTQARREACN